MKLTHTLLSVVIAIMERPDDYHWGYELTRKTGVRSGVLYPLLGRMLDEGWLTDGWEDPATIQGRPPRRYYQLTGDGRTALDALLQRASTDRRFRGWQVPARHP